MNRYDLEAAVRRVEGGIFCQLHMKDYLNRGRKGRLREPGPRQ